MTDYNLHFLTSHNYQIKGSIRTHNTYYNNCRKLLNILANISTASQILRLHL